MSREEFNKYVTQMSRMLYVYAFRIVKNREEAEDAVQEVFVRLWNMGKKLDSINSVEALAVTMTKNYCIDLLRKQKHSALADDLSQDIRNDSTPHEIFEQAESGIIIRRIIEELPELYRTIINLHEVEGLSYEEISDKTNMNINSLRVIISRARSTIRDKYKSYFNEKRRT